MENNEPLPLVEHVPIFFESIFCSCPICGRPVKKVIETDWEPQNMVECESEYYSHYIYNGEHKLVKFNTPKHNYY